MQSSIKSRSLRDVENRHDNGGTRAFRLYAVITLCFILAACCFPAWAGAETQPAASATGAAGTNTAELDLGDVAQVVNGAAECAACTVLGAFQPGAAVCFNYVTADQVKTAQPAKEQEATNEVTYPIEITQSAWQHVMKRHTAGGPENAGKSIFNAGVDIRALIKKAETATPVPEPNGYYSREFDAGRNIGYDGRSGEQTRVFRVITTQAGKLVTAYPVVK